MGPRDMDKFVFSRALASENRYLSIPSGTIFPYKQAMMDPFSHILYFLLILLIFQLFSLVQSVVLSPRRLTRKDT